MARDAGKAFLRVVKGDDKGKGWELTAGSPCTIGRSRSSTMRLRDTSASASHARVEHVDGTWQVLDLDSTHGTYANKQRLLAPKPLFDRDVIRIGHTSIEFREYEQLDQDTIGEVDGGVVLPG